RTIREPRIYLVTGKSSLKQSGYLEIIKSNLSEANIFVEVYDKAGKEPTTNILNKGKEEFLEKGCDLIVGVGGGSVMDTAKGIAGLASNGGIVEDYHAGREFINPPVPFILIPTTAGTGSEVTNNAVIKDAEKGIKKSIRGLYATVALLDPEITLSLPKTFTAYPGADALVQAIESLVSKASNYISDLFAKESIKLLGKSLPKVYDDLDNVVLREKMMLGSLLGAISFANGKLGAVHGFAHPIGVKHNVPHGLICGLLLPYVMEYNIALESVVDKYAWIAELFRFQKILTNYGESSSKLPKEKKEKAKWVIQKIKDIFTYIDIPMHLTEIGIEEEHLDAIVIETKGSSLDNNPRDTDKESLKNILLNAL
ncbi:MAG: iron-containing alcohol dehydrogenase, partial [Candidatus Lokiarchaeota archaeon]|nr:iron-containing alcohol dehydrogenase [Candidatus Lokiarchaeota archaeon]MBD3340262.1 iron-containing alcohol dehydrogenase [Candidatus Lokiarchaeota archaeon]